MASVNGGSAMSFVSNDYEQMSITDPIYSFSERQKRFLKNSWAIYFAEHVFPKIDEAPFAILYSDKVSRPNTPVNVIFSYQISTEPVSFPFTQQILFYSSLT